VTRAVSVVTNTMANAIQDSFTVFRLLGNSYSVVLTRNYCIHGINHVSTVINVI
jgi:hypothetical protein